MISQHLRTHKKKGGFCLPFFYVASVKADQLYQTPAINLRMKKSFVVPTVQYNCNLYSGLKPWNVITNPDILNGLLVV